MPTAFAVHAARPLPLRRAADAVQTPAGALGLWREVFRLIRRRPGILVPFAFLAILEAYALLVLTDPPPVLRDWLSTFISRQFGSAYAAFPLKTAVLPAVFAGTRMGLDVVVGSMMAAWVTARVVFLVRGESMGLGGAFAAAARRYGAAMALTVLSLVLSRALVKALAALVAMARTETAGLSPAVGATVLIACTFAAVTLAQAALVYTLPALVGERLSFLRAVRSSLGQFRARPVTTVLLVAVPVLPFFLLSLAASLAPGFTMLRSPQAVTGLLLGGIVAGFVARTLVVAGAAAAHEWRRPLALLD